jgi:TPR repeat protein
MHYPKNGSQDDLDEAIKWFRRAAENGHWPAQFWLAHLYGWGWGVQQDYVQAYRWEETAIHGLSATSPLYEIRLKTLSEYRTQLTAKMTPQQIAEAERLAAEWIKQHPTAKYQ